MLNIKQTTKGLSTILIMIIASTLWLDCLSLVVKAESKQTNANTFGLGIGIANPEVNLEVGPNKLIDYARQEIQILSPYHMGYKLDVKSADDDSGGSMIGEKYSEIIAPTSSTMLSENSWGLATVGSSETIAWRGIGSEAITITENVGRFPSDQVVVVNYGVHIPPSKISDTYKVELTYTLTAALPSSEPGQSGTTTPVVTMVAPTNFDIDKDKGNRELKLSGINIGGIEEVGVDFNGDGKMEDNEVCENLKISFTMQATCQLPYIPLKSSGGKFDILIRNDDDTVSTGHTITYYYTPTVDTISRLADSVSLGDSDNKPTLNLNPKDSVKVVDMLHTGVSSMVLTDDGEVYLWGETNIYDAANNNFQVYSRIPMPSLVSFTNVKNKPVITSIAGSGQSYYAVDQLSNLYSWGDNNNYQLSNEFGQGWINQPTVNPRFDATRIMTENFLGPVSSVAAGNGFTIVLNNSPRKSKGNLLFSWGRNNRGQMGVGNDKLSFSSSISLVHVQGNFPYVEDEKYLMVDTGTDFAVGLTNKGRIYTWGWHGNEPNTIGDGRLGFNTNSIAYEPYEITGANGGGFLKELYKTKTFIQVAAGDNFALALTDDGEIYSWGNNDHGQLGNSGQESEAKAYNILTNFIGASKIVGIDADGVRGVAWTEDGQVYTWGNGQLKPEQCSELGALMVDKITLGVVNYLRTTDGRLFSWVIGQPPKDITEQLSRPLEIVKVTGKNLSRSIIWLDINDDGKLQESEHLEQGRVCNYQSDVGDICYLQIPLTIFPRAGTYRIYFDTGYAEPAVAEAQVMMTNVQHGLVKEPAVVVSKISASPLTSRPPTTKPSAIESGDKEADGKRNEDNKDNDDSEGRENDTDEIATGETDPEQSNVDKPMESVADEIPSEDEDQPEDNLETEDTSVIPPADDHLDPDDPIEEDDSALTGGNESDDQLLEGSLIEGEDGSTESIGDGVSGINIDDVAEPAVLLYDRQSLELKLPNAEFDSFAR